MKKYISTLVLVFAVAVVFASDPAYVVKAKPINLDKIVGSIDYPKVSNENGVEGTVLMYVEIDEKGNISNTTALSFPCSHLKESVEKALMKLKFEPAKNHLGEAVASSVRIPFEFELTVD